MFGDAVIYTEGGKEYNALVMTERGNPTHNSTMISLIFLKEVIDPITNQPKRLAGTGHQGDLVNFRIDVPHTAAGESLAYWSMGGKKLHLDPVPDPPQETKGATEGPKPKRAVTVKPKGAA